MQVTILPDHITALRTGPASDDSTIITSPYGPSMFATQRWGRNACVRHRRRLL